eukprot:g8368.t1
MEITPYILAAREYDTAIQIQLLSNTTANAQSTGYKEERMTFAPLTMPFEKETKSPPFSEVTYAVRNRRWRDTQQGALMETKNPLHVALNGPGYLRLEGNRYTRDGALYVDNEGRIVSSDGVAFLSEDGEVIQVPEGSEFLRIDRDGTISNQTGAIGTLALTEFADNATLLGREQNRYEPTLPGQPAQETQVVQGFLEKANTKLPTVLVNLQEASHDYKMCGELVKAFYSVMRDAMPQLLTVTL